MEKTLFKKEFFDSAIEYSKCFIDAINYSVSHFHAVEHCSNKLINSGFIQLKESENWDLKKGGKYFFTRNQSSLYAFTVGGKFNVNTTKFKIIGTHTDSPNLRFAPNSWTKSGNTEKLHLERYGGGMWNTWFDRDLSFCGRIIYKDNESGDIKSKLIRINDTLFNIPMLAIHLVEGRNKPFDWNNENHLKAILSMGLEIEESKEVKESKSTDIDKKIGSKLADLISKELNLPKEQILDYELVCYDTNPSKIIGINKEYISSGRLDNLCSSLCATDAIISGCDSIKEQDSINLVAMFDNEECGSQSYQGADNDLFPKTLERIFNTIEDENKREKDSFLIACNKSLVISADLAHATHPNYEEKHHSTHRVPMHCGLVIKHNANLSYATDREGTAIVKDIAKNANVPVLDFMVRQDSPCGTTIGPIISSHLGIKAVDVGVGIWGMHSIRETGSTIDTYHYYLFMSEYFKDNRKTYNMGI